MNRVGQKILVTVVILLEGFLLLGLLKGGVSSGAVDYQETKLANIKVGSPFESSGSTSRYVLTEAIVENGTFFLNEERAKFAAPDVAKYNGKYFSIFAPGVSFLGIPFYWAGKKVGLPQLATYLSTALFAFLNTLLVTKITRKIGAGFYTSALSGLLFLFATNALSYSLTFTQHHASTFIILLGTLSALGRRDLLNNIWFGILYGAGLLMDIPNGIIMLPLLFYVLVKQFDLVDTQQKLKLTIKLNFIGLLIGLTPVLAIFGWYNHQLTDSYTTVAQFIGRSRDFRDAQDSEKAINIVDKKEKRELPFNTRSQINGLYILLVSNQRGITVYTPIVLLGLVGFYIIYQQSRKPRVLPVDECFSASPAQRDERSANSFAVKLAEKIPRAAPVELHKKSGKNKEVALLGTVILSNLIIYSMFGDPYGGWAFGSRYLIPGVAILSTGIGVAVDKYKRNIFFLFTFLLLSAYSIGVNVLGAMTTANVPPKVETVNLPNPAPYTYEYNWQLITEKGLNSSLVYNLYLSDKFSPKDYASFYVAFVFALVMILYIISFFEKKEANQE